MYCPVSHIPLSELQQPVVFSHKKHSVVFDADYLTHWLRSGMLRDPITNEPILADRADRILEPFRLPHSTDDDLERTRRFLKKAGRLDGMGGDVSLVVVGIRILFWAAVFGAMVFGVFIIPQNWRRVCVFTNGYARNPDCRNALLTIMHRDIVHWIDVYVFYTRYFCEERRHGPSDCPFIF